MLEEAQWARKSPVNLYVQSHLISSRQSLTTVRQEVPGVTVAESEAKKITPSYAELPWLG